MSWKLPDTPKSEGYTEALRWIASAETADDGKARFRFVCEEDFWFFVRYASSFGNFINQEPGHPMIGEPWAEHPWVFERCRELQKDSEEGANDVFYNFPRFSFKTQLITKLLTIWELLKDPTLTAIFLTFKVDQTGETMYEDTRAELEKNPILLDHWPDRLARDTREYPLWTNTACTILRPLGPREPSLSIHSVTSPPTSFHPRRVIVDDAVTDKTVENVETIAKTFRAMQVLTPLAGADTIFRWVGTIWDKFDPYMQGLEDGLFARRSLWACYHEDGEPVLHTAKFLAEWRRKMGEYLFSANMLNNPISKGDQYFNKEWLDYKYQNDPLEEAQGKNVYIFIDIASGTEDGDFTAMWSIGLGEDRKYYALDLVRDRLQLTEFLDALFEMVKKWRPETVWLEHYFDGGYYDTIVREMEARKIRFNLRKIPRIGSQKTSRSKEQRIIKLQPMMERGEIYWPSNGFGRHSKIKGREGQDTFAQFVREEFSFWTPLKNSVLHDDMLDALAWIAQPEMQKRLRWPENVQPTEETNPFDPAVRAARNRKAAFSAITGWAY